MRDDLKFFMMTESDALRMLLWREPKSCRTSWPITAEGQRKWYSGLDARESQWWGIYQHETPGSVHVGCVALQHIDWVNGRAEISLVVDPARRGSGIGSEAVKYVSAVAFYTDRLTSIWGECYQCSGAVPFWEKVVERWEPYSHSAKVPATKFCEGKLSWSLIFTLMQPGLRPDVPTEEIGHNVTGVV